MNGTDAAGLREDFLGRLDAAMGSVPHGVANEIRAGIAEELDGLDAEATAARIAQLGDPVQIAREARDETLSAPEGVVVEPGPTRPATATRGFAIVAALTLSFGGIVLPFAGWIVGGALVCFSSLWRTWEKLMAILIPLAVAAASIVVASTMWGFASNAQSGNSSGGGDFSAPNPLVPTGYDIGWSTLVVCGLLLIPASGLWLLWRLRGRAGR